MKKNSIKILFSTFIFLFFLVALYGSGEDKNNVNTEETTIENTNQDTQQEPAENNTEINSEPTLAEKKVMCQRMFGGGDLSAWETAQAECMLNNSESACECMQILVQ